VSSATRSNRVAPSSAYEDKADEHDAHGDDFRQAGRFLEDDDVEDGRLDLPGKCRLVCMNAAMLRSMMATEFI